MMIKDFILPDIGEGIVECEIVEWLVAEGESISEDQPIVEVMTDKAVVQIPAIAAGKIIKLFYKKGDIAKVHSPLFTVEETPQSSSGIEEDNTERAINKPEEGSQSPLFEANETISYSTVNKKDHSHQADITLKEDSNKSKNLQKVLATPAIRRRARSWEIALEAVKGSGKSGRILEDDLLKYQSITGVSAGISQEPVITTTPSSKKSEAITGIRKQMARQMSLSSSTIPHFTYNDEMDITKLVILKKDLKKEVNKLDVKLTYLSFFIKALSLAVKEFPILNASVNEDVTEIMYHQSVNIGIAVDTSRGLIVPNIKDVDKLTILEISQEISRLTETAKNGRIAAEDLKGGTITISNIGAIGGGHSTPLISPPEVAIVALGKIQLLPRYLDSNELVPRHILYTSWSGDHRVIDGATMARFCNLWKSFIEDPLLMLIKI